MTERSMKMLNELDASAKFAFQALLQRLDLALGDTQYIVFEGRRTLAVQEAYYAQGREPLESVNAKRQKAGLYLLRSDKDNYVITWTMDSKHIKGFAMDILPVDGAGRPTWDLAHYKDKFDVIKNCAKVSGLICGADWNPQDWPHYEVR